ncbi:uncharacterized protein LOC119674268 [Teleopsis dalmanni]|uniref:uncharacterized protein LOC119674268 n=1 Tax=Teleopsis dalmanni TaxID=139649 RepID=UPI0018CD9699|nr:uncharacterized protein LOC119674268 [Teleopsis dalmanni]
MNRQSRVETQRKAHARLLEELDNLNLSDSCCEICHCDCYNSHRSSDDLSITGLKFSTDCCGFDEFNDICNLTEPKVANTAIKKTGNGKKTTTNGVAKKSKVKKKKNASTNKTSKSAKTTPIRQSTSPEFLRTTTIKKRSKSAGSVRSQSGVSDISTQYTRDCKILQELLTSLDQPTEGLKISGKRSSMLTRNSTSFKKLPPWPSLGELPTCSTKAIATDTKLTLSPLKLSESMANLCLAPTVREAYQRVPSHDQKILNRMANKRSEKATAKENAWLAQKYWENERYERELIKVEQMEEYKRAVRDKQFQDYLFTKARLNEIAQRDLTELQRLRGLLQEKDKKTKRRLDALRVERDITICQRRCDELRKAEAVNVQQEEQQLDETLRKREICNRLTERLQRADEIRSRMLGSYLKRIRYANYVEQLMHDEHWRDVQVFEKQKRELLKDHIDQKRTKCQRFVEKRQRRNEALSKTAKISASLRELVRNSVTPEGGAAGSGLGATAGFSGSVPASLSKLLLDRPISKLAL